MDMRLDKAGTCKAPSRVVGFGCTRQPALNRDDLASGNADIQWLRQRPIGKAGIANNQVHVISFDMSPVPTQPCAAEVTAEAITRLTSPRCRSRHASRSCLGLGACVGSSTRRMVVARVLLTAAAPPALRGGSPPAHGRSPP